MYNAIVNFIGAVPQGMEPIVYLFSMIVTVFLLNSFVSFINSVFKGR